MSMFDTYQHLNLIFWFCQIMAKKLGLWPKYQVASKFRTKDTFSLIVVFTPWSCPRPPTIPPNSELRLIKMVPNDSQYSKNMGLDTKIRSPACWGPKLQLHSLKLSVASYSPSILFLTVRSISASCKCPGPRNLGLDTKTNCLSWPETKLQLFDTRFHLGPQNGDFEKENIKWVRSWSEWVIFLWGTHIIIYNLR